MADFKTKENIGIDGDLETIEGIVEEKIFENEDNGFAVCDIEYKKDIITAVGDMPYINEGETVKLYGKWVTHNNYGEQFKVEYYEKVLPQTITMIQKYLASGAIKGIREATAKKIVKEFGDKSLEIIRNHPERLAEIKGISKKKAIDIGKVFEEQAEVQKIVMFLQEYSISISYAIKAYKKFGNDAIEKIKNNPYILCEEIDGIGFKTADKIAISLGIEYNNVDRIKSGIKYLLAYNSNNGHAFLPKDIITKSACRLLGVSENEVSDVIISMTIDKTIYIERIDKMEEVYLIPFHHAEIGVARKLRAMVATPLNRTCEDIEADICNIEDDIEIKLAHQQKEAVRQALNSGVLVVTGGPGTGKTTTINTIIRIMENKGYKVVLAAPTGRAAKRMSELTGKEAKTIHRLLEIGYADDNSGMQFEKDQLDTLEADVIIIDEASMIDIVLMNGLLKAILPGTRLIMVGDTDQLPSVGPGNVLKDIIESETVNVVKLTEIFRQAQQSMIIINAHKINKGEYPELNIKDKDFYFLNRNSSAEITSSILELCNQRLPKCYGYDPINNIQVLTPMRKSPLGVISLNTELQKVLNAPSSDKKEKVFGNIIFREGDKVMQIKNNYNAEWKRLDDNEKGSGIFNGDVGYITKINKVAEMITVIFDDEKQIKYGYNQLDELELAYAITIHKSQGNEFPAVVMPIFSGAPMLMSRNLFYTAVTRARELVVLVGKKSVIKSMVDNNRVAKRYSGLKRKLEYPL